MQTFPQCIFLLQTNMLGPLEGAAEDRGVGGDSLGCQEDPAPEHLELWTMSPKLHKPKQGCLCKPDLPLSDLDNVPEDPGSGGCFSDCQFSSSGDLSTSC